MSTNSLLRRLDALELAGSEANETHRFVLVEVFGDKPDCLESGSSYIISQCEASCDIETYESALGDAFMAIRGTNPLLLTGKVIIHISTEIALKVVENLAAKGIEVKL